MVTSITRWCHNTLITFATMQFVFRQQLQKLQKWWKDCDHCGTQEILMSVWHSILLDKWNPVVLDIGYVLTVELVLGPARPFLMNLQDRNVTGNPSLLECDAALVCSAEDEGSTFIQNIRNHHHSNTVSHSRRSGPSTATEMSNAAYKHHCFQKSWWVSVSDVVPSSFIWM